MEAEILPVEIDERCEMPAWAQAAGGIVGPAVIAARSNVAAAGPSFRMGAPRCGRRYESVQRAVAIADGEEPPAANSMAM